LAALLLWLPKILLGELLLLSWLPFPPPLALGEFRWDTLRR